jgi:hypothetical protein
MPLVLQLHKTEGGQEYAEFLHLPRKKFSDFGKGHRIRLLRLQPSTLLGLFSLGYICGKMFSIAVKY